MRIWLLPEYIEDILPPEAARIEALRTRLLELFRVHGYRLVIPPMLEYVESLLTGTGHDLDLRTFKLVDQLSGRMMGIRADITPQVARIDAHLLNEQGVTRLCYAGSVLHTRPRGLDATREPLQIGAELYGHAGIESDLEIQRLLCRSLESCGLDQARLDIGHVGVFRALCARGGVPPEVENELHAALQAKDVSGIEALTARLRPATRDALRCLPQLYGDKSMLRRARRALPAYPEISSALDDLARLCSDNGFSASIDLADLRGYRYHSGVVFAAYVPGLSNAVALGGRYDEVGRAFGRPRPATGFSMDLRDLARVAGERSGRGAIRAPRHRDPALGAAVRKLRARGEVVIAELPGEKARHADCDRELARVRGEWQVRGIKN
ncbi:MAG: ATP phosphoribosyltransferase regulatory subunit [Betaproteobacteria bacterium RIFCSPLOWO2_02_FULL_64_12]|nr:MAG: ATP phosphoribosyltransferase regulatory subunit [Betaproteobacteria bacterium RIFCSPLOWO2_02_FULL_64_12]